MADFCMQCSIEIFGEDFEDLAGLGNGDPLPEGMGWTALCEECGPTLVDDTGRCIWTGCERHGEKRDGEQGIQDR